MPRPRRSKSIICAAVLLCLTVFAIYKTTSVVLRRHAFRQLAAAIERNDVAQLEELLNSGLDVNARSTEGLSPLHLSRSARIAQLLIKRGALVNAQTDAGNTPLHLAACLERADVVSIFLKCGADVNAMNAAEETPLHMLCSDLLILRSAPELFDGGYFRGERTGNQPEQTITLMLLLDNGGNIETRNESGRTPAYIAAMTPPRLELLDVLIRHGAATNISDSCGRPFLGDEYSAAEADVVQLVRTKTSQAKPVTVPNR